MHEIYADLLDAMLKIFPEADRGIIYHYTSVNVLWEFLRPDYDFWCTYCRSLSDPTEFQTGMFAVTRFLKRFFKKEKFEDTFAHMLALCGDHGLNYMPWTLSFSTAEDDTGQWRQYTDRNDGGCAVGFNREAIVSALQDEHNMAQNNWAFVTLLPCVYLEDGAENKIESLFQYAFTTLVQELKEVFKKEKNNDQIAVGLVGLLLASLMKHKDFREEKEWRLIVQPLELGAVAENVDMIGGKSRIRTGLWGEKLDCPIKVSGREHRMPCPVSQMKLNTKDVPNRRVGDMIERIIISPHGPSGDLLDRGKLFVALRGLKNGDCSLVVPSESPYRG